MSQITTAAPAADEFARDPKIEQQVAELRELQAKYPEPPWEVVAEEWKWLYAEQAKWVEDPDWAYWNKYIVVYQQRIVGAGTDFFELQLSMVREYEVHPGRFAITAFGEYF